MVGTTIREDTSLRHVHKYANKNPIHRLALGRFYDAMAKEIGILNPESVLDFGCGEGFLVDQLAERNVTLANYCGVDLREDALTAARTRHADVEFVNANIFDWPNDERQFDLVIASEVMEHLIEPETFLPRLASLAKSHVLLTVPHEPWFQISNLVRGRDFIRLGNHPEHINHWNLKTFQDFVSNDLKVVKAFTVFPFVYVLAQPA